MPQGSMLRLLYNTQPTSPKYRCCLQRQSQSNIRIAICLMPLIAPTCFQRCRQPFCCCILPLLIPRNSISHIRLWLLLLLFLLLTILR
jgi:hypothetical protein